MVCKRKKEMQTQLSDAQAVLDYSYAASEQ